MLYFIVGVLVGPALSYYAAKLAWRFYVLLNARDPRSEYSNLQIPPGDFGLPLVGETILWAIEGSRFNSSRREKYGKVFSTNIIGKTMVKVTGPEFVKQILTAGHDTVTTIWPTSVRRILGEHSIANSFGGIHKYKRKMCLKAFTHAALNSYIPAMRREVKRRMKLWSDPSLTPIMYQETKELTFDVAFSVLVGLSFKNDQERGQLFKTFDDMITNLFSLPFDLPGSGLRKGMAARKVLHELLDVHLKEKRRIVEAVVAGEEELEGNRNNALHYIMEAELEDKLRKKSEQSISDDVADDVDDDEDHELSDIELKEATVEMLFAGYQTTASVATSCVINLIKCPKVFRKLEEELEEYGFLPTNKNTHVEDSSREDVTSSPDKEYVIDNTIPDLSTTLRKRHSDDVTVQDNANNNTSLPQNSKKNLETSKNHLINVEEPADRPITMETIAKMSYLEQVIKETLRVMPPILGGYRKALKTFKIGNYRVPKGWTIIYNIRDTHESEWAEDMDFKPDRFSDWKDNREGRYKWIPFGGGPRMCVGKEFARLQLKLILIEMIRSFSKMEFAKGVPPKMFAIPFLHPTDGLPVKLTMRTKYQHEEQE